MKDVPPDVTAWLESLLDGVACNDPAARRIAMTLMRGGYLDYITQVEPISHGRSKGGRKRGKAISHEALMREMAVDDAAKEYRDQHAYDRNRWSTRRMAEDIGRELEIPMETVRSILQRLDMK